MKILLLLVLVLLAAVAVRWLITARNERPASPPDGNGGEGTRVPFRASGQVFRALRAARPTQVKHAQKPQEPGSGPMLRP